MFDCSQHQRQRTPSGKPLPCATCCPLQFYAHAEIAGPKRRWNPWDPGDVPTSLSIVETFYEKVETRIGALSCFLWMTADEKARGMLEQELRDFPLREHMATRVPFKALPSGEQHGEEQPENSQA